MLKRLVSLLIIISLLWSDIAAAMNDEEDVKSPSSRGSSLGIKGTNLLPKNVATEKSPLLTNGTHPVDLTPMMDVVSPHTSINGGIKNSGSSSDEEERKRDSISSEYQDPIGESKKDKKKCSSCWPCKKKKEKEIFIIYPSDSEDEKQSVDSRLCDEEKKPCCLRLCWPSCCKKKVEEEDVESSHPSKTCCWPFSCCKKKGVEEHFREKDSLLIIEEEPSLKELKKQLLLNLVIPLEEEKSSDVINLEEQILDEQEVLLQKARFLYSKIKGTSLEDFGNWLQGHVVHKRWRWQDWGGLLLALGMAAGTGAAMPPIVEYSVYNSFLAAHLKEYRPFLVPLAKYIMVSTGAVALTDASSFMLDTTSPSTGTFTTPKSKAEKKADRILIPLSSITASYLVWLGFQIQQILKKDEGSTGFWTNKHDQFWLITSPPLFAYLVMQTQRSIKAAVSKRFHPIVPEHVKELVNNLRLLNDRLDQLAPEALDDLYAVLHDPVFKKKPSEWASYFKKGEVSDESKVEGLLSFIALKEYAAKAKELNLEEELEPSSAKKRIAARILGGLGLPAGFSLIAISVFGLLSAFMDTPYALALSIVAATAGFCPEAFLQAHNVEETFDDMGSKTKGPHKSFCESLKDPWAWGRGAAKVVGMIWSFLQNTLTNLMPIFVSLAMLVPETLGGREAVQTAMTGVMITLAIPFLMSELLSGTRDMYGHAVTMTYAVHDFFANVLDYCMKCCGKKREMSPIRKKRAIRRILENYVIPTTMQLSPDHVYALNIFEQQFKGVEEVY